jgi:hypothetical protein
MNCVVLGIEHEVFLLQWMLIQAPNISLAGVEGFRTSEPQPRQLLRSKSFFHEHVMMTSLDLSFVHCIFFITPLPELTQNILQYFNFFLGKSFHIFCNTKLLAHDVNNRGNQQAQERVISRFFTRPSCP